ncbi:MAG: Gfo/Idh/MocA family oxidoreductase [Chloroflexi bacterium]|nr:Gfo/Idh/MocA family oxidoreductase [Chloroflexota bacterium]
MAERRLRVGVVGIGFVGAAHIDAIRRIPHAEVVAVASSSRERAQRHAADLDIPRAYGDYRELVADPDVDVVHNCTPNVWHFPIDRAILEAGKACYAEKPLAMNAAEAEELARIARATGSPAAVTFNHRGFPQVQEARSLVAEGALGRVHAVHGAYLQDWLLRRTDWSWRLDPAIGGPTRAVADIGSHWMDLVQHVTGRRIVAVMADLTTVVPMRSRPASEPETFRASTGEVIHAASADASAGGAAAGGAAAGGVAAGGVAATGGGDASIGDSTASAAPAREVRIDTEDFASVLVRLEDGARGSFTVSQMSAGRKNRLTFEVDGLEGALSWCSEESEWLWRGSRGAANAVVQRSPAGAHVPGLSRLPAGHAEGWADAMLNVIRGFYDQVRIGQRQPWVATFEDGLYAARLVDAILESSRSERWVTVGQPPCE